MEAVILARIQFAALIGFHFLFPPTTFGLTLVMLVIESLYLATGREIYKTISQFLAKVLGLVFAVGVASGIVMEFSFGTNWGEYSKIVGNIFGPLLAAEGILAFFLESVFIGVILFGRNRVHKAVYWLSIVLVFLAAHMSGFWIIVANSWMQTPAGYTMENGRAVLTDFAAAVWNPSTIVRFVHTTVAGWLTGAFFTGAIAAYFLIKKRFADEARILFITSMSVVMLTGVVQLFTGHAHSVQVGKTQPAKMAAFEGLWESTDAAPLTLFGLPDEKNEKTHLAISLPRMLSFLIYGDFSTRVAGLKEFDKGKRPPVMLPFASYHIMIVIGMYLFAFALLTGLLMLLRKLTAYVWYLWAAMLSFIVPHIANQTGWIAAEVGRQPWVVYDVLLTKNAVSLNVPAWQIAASLIMIFGVELFLLGIFIIVLRNIIAKGMNTTTAGY
ncbi:MAG: cytochrome ubiquinol oxidase subunit I [Spirochaetes bacterium]|nr:cytochrome ubiquinol oxidase subunit I [Spirochaetota bacterium]